MLDKFFLQAKNQIMSQQKSDIDSIVMRINLRISELGIKAAEINRRLNKSPGWIYNLLKQERHSLIKNLDDIAEALECSSVWLQYGDPFPKDQFVSDNLQIKSKSPIRESIAIGQPMGKIRTGKFVEKPILYLQEAEDWKIKTEELMHTARATAILDSRVYSPDCFPVLIENDYNYPKFNIGDVLIVDPGIQPKPGVYAVVKLLDSEQIVFAQYNIKETNVVLKFLNEQYSDILLSKELVKIIGIAVYKQEKLSH